MNKELIINSKGEFFFFEMDEWKKINYTKYNHKYISTEALSLLKDKVLTFTTTIDNKNNIHLIVLTLSGKLLYYLYQQDKWSNALIANFDTKYNIYKNMNIILDNDNVNIIYSYSNLINTNLWTIQHTLYKKKTWGKYNIISFLGHKSNLYFNIDKDSFGTIHLLYNNIQNNNLQINYTFYNPFAKLWNKSTNKLSKRNTNNHFPYIFIDSKNNLHALWLEKTSENNRLKYFILSTIGNNKYKWSEKGIPNITNCINMPIIFEEKEMLKIVYLIDNHIGFLYSLDYGNTWSKGDLLKIDSSKIFLVKVSGNSKDIKIKNAYCSGENILNLYFINSFKPNLTTPSSTIMESPCSKSEQFIPESKREDEKFSNIYNTQDEIKNMLINILDSQNKIENKIDIILTKLEEDKKSIFSKFFIS